MVATVENMQCFNVDIAAHWVVLTWSIWKQRMNKLSSSSTTETSSQIVKSTKHLIEE